MIHIEDLLNAFQTYLDEHSRLYANEEFSDLDPAALSKMAEEAAAKLRKVCDDAGLPIDWSDRS